MKTHPRSSSYSERGGEKFFFYLPMRRIFFFIFLSLYTATIFAEKSDSIKIWGHVCDAFTMHGLIDGVQVELLDKDSVLLQRQQWSQEDRTESSFTMNALRGGTYIIRVSHPEYSSLTKKFTVRSSKREKRYSIGPLKLRRLPMNSQALDEVVIKATKIKFFTRGDTVIYNANAFNLAQGSMLDAMISQLPGARLERNGQLFVNGKKVESLLLNGKDFFKGDHSVLLDNLPAYTIEDIKVYNRLSELSQRLGQKVDDGDLVMDINLKKQYQVGWLGNVEAGGGTHDRWLGRVFLTRFTPQSRVSLYATANNTHENRKPGQDGEWLPSDIGNGTSTTEKGGIDYTISDKYGLFDLEGQLNAQHTDNDNISNQATEHFQQGNTTFGRNWSKGNSQTTEIYTRHRMYFRLGPERSRNSINLTVTPELNFYRANGNNRYLQAEFRQDPTVIGSAGFLQEQLQSPAIQHTLLDSLLINRVRSEQLSHATKINGGAVANLSLSVPFTGGILGISAGFDADHLTDERHDLYRLDYSSSESAAADNRRRYFNLPSDKKHAMASIEYSHGFDEKWEWMIMPHLDYNFTQTEQENSLYRLDLLEDMASAPLGSLPSTREALLSTLDISNSYLTDNRLHDVTLSLRGRYDHVEVRKGRRYSRLRFIWDPRITMQSEEWIFTGEEQSQSSRTVWLPGMRLELLRNTPGMKHQLELIADYSQKMPSMFQLMGLRFDSDPLNVEQGNPNLRRTGIYTLLFKHSSRPKNIGMISTHVTVNIYQNALATGQFYNPENGVRTYCPQNVNGNWSTNGSVWYVTPLGKQKRFNLEMQLENQYVHSVDLTSNNEDALIRSYVKTNYLKLPLSLEYSHDKLRVGVKASAAWNHAASEREGFQNVDAADITYGLFGHWNMPWGFTLATDLNYYTRYGYSNEQMNSRDWVWNAQLSKSFLKGKLILTAVGFDLLGQLSNITYSLNAQGSMETWKNVIPRYGMLRIAYRFSKKPEKK